MQQTQTGSTTATLTQVTTSTPTTNTATPTTIPTIVEPTPMEVLEEAAKLWDSEEDPTGLACVFADVDVPAVDETTGVDKLVER